MIKFFVRENKLNAVDNKNRLVGFDLDDDCCAHGGWFVDDKIVNKEPAADLRVHLADLDDYEFDPDFMEKVSGDGDYSEYGAVVFRMLSTEPPHYNRKPLYLHLYNVHNGYYSKGFTFTADGNTKEGTV